VELSTKVGRGLGQGRHHSPESNVNRKADYLSNHLSCPHPVVVGEEMFKTPAWEKEDFIPSALSYLSFRKSPLEEGRLRGLASQWMRYW
jgi:hypothetical protein